MTPSGLALRVGVASSKKRISWRSRWAVETTPTGRVAAATAALVAVKGLALTTDH